MQLRRGIRYQWFSLAALALALAAGRLQATPEESRTWDAVRKFAQDATSPMAWALVEGRFADFIKKYPASEHYAEAVVYEARAMLEQGKPDAVINLLSIEASNAGTMADRFAYWTAKAYAKKKDLPMAADTYARLVRAYPTSDLRLEAIFREAEAHAKLGYWPKVIEELRESDGVFQQAAKTNRNDEFLVSGLLLLGEAELEQKDYPGATKTLASISPQKLGSELEWDRLSLISRSQLAGGHAQEALETSTNLFAAVVMGKPESKAKSIVLKGEILEQLDQLSGAIEVYELNLNSDLPGEWRRQALLKIVDLTLRQNQPGEAAKRLEEFLAKHLEEKGGDVELLVLGEILLQEYYRPTEGTEPPTGGTNLLHVAGADFEKLIKVFTNSPYLGKAELNLGWCLSAEGKTNESQAAFSQAIAHLPPSEDQAVARFKLADILFQQRDFGGAAANYAAIIDQYGSLAAVTNALFEPALYQIVRANLRPTNSTPTNLSAATDAMNRILTWFPNGSLGEPSMLLVGQAQSPTNAREVFTEFAARFPQSPLLPEVKLAVARTYENEMRWAEAGAQYDEWVHTYTNSWSLPQAEFSRAWANYRGGNETNAFLLFTNFVARFVTNPAALSNDLPAMAQYWVGGFYWHQEDFQKAELSYKEIFNKWPESTLAFQARMMAGSAAMASQSPQAAIAYFTNLFNLSSSPNCPPGLAAQALFAIGDATLQLPPTTNFSKYGEAIQTFAYITTHYTNSPIAASAWGRYGDCYFALAANDPAQYETAKTAFEKVIGMESSVADITTRSMAEVRLAQTLEAMATAPGAEKKKLQERALSHLTNVLYGNNLRDNEQSDSYWVKLAGLEAGALAEESGEWGQAIQFYQRLQKNLPPLVATLDKKIAKARDHLTPEKN